LIERGYAKGDFLKSKESSGRKIEDSNRRSEAQNSAPPEITQGEQNRSPFT
jgi:hypothetical protein